MVKLMSVLEMPDDSNPFTNLDTDDGKRTDKSYSPVELALMRTS